MLARAALVTNRSWAACVRTRERAVSRLGDPQLVVVKIWIAPVKSPTSSTRRDVRWARLDSRRTSTADRIEPAVGPTVTASRDCASPSRPPASRRRGARRIVRSKSGRLVVSPRVPRARGPRRAARAARAHATADRTCTAVRALALRVGERVLLRQTGRQHPDAHPTTSTVASTQRHVEDAVGEAGEGDLRDHEQGESSEPATTTVTISRVATCPGGSRRSGACLDLVQPPAAGRICVAHELRTPVAGTPRRPAGPGGCSLARPRSARCRRGSWSASVAAAAAGVGRARRPAR